jgi:hypothetical protein
MEKPMEVCTFRATAAMLSRCKNFMAATGLTKLPEVVRAALHEYLEKRGY